MQCIMEVTKTVNQFMAVFLKLIEANLFICMLGYHHAALSEIEVDKYHHHPEDGDIIIKQPVPKHGHLCLFCLNSEELSYIYKHLFSCCCCTKESQ